MAQMMLAVVFFAGTIPSLILFRTAAVVITLEIEAARSVFARVGFT